MSNKSAAKPATAATTAAPAKTEAKTAPVTATTPATTKPVTTTTTTTAPVTTTTTTTTTTPANNNNNSNNEVKVSRPNVFIGNLSFKTTSEDLKAHLSSAGTVVNAEVLTYRDSSRSKGCGLAEFKTTTEAAKAIATLTNSTLNERKIFLREDREEKGFGKDESVVSNNPNYTTEGRRGRGRGNRARGTRGTRGSRGGGSRGGRGGNSSNSSSEQPQKDDRPSNTNPANLYVGNLPFTTTDDELKSVFSKFGALKLATVSVSTTGRSKGFGTVAFNRQQDAKAAIDALNDTDFNGRQMVVRVDHYAE